MTRPASQHADDVLELTREDHVAYLWLSRPAAGNRLSRLLVARLQAALDALDADAAIHVIVLGGRGRDFCRGHDEQELEACADPRTRRAAYLAANDFMLALAASPKVTIARVQGHAGGAGLELVAACDLAVAAADARFAAGLAGSAWAHTTQVALSRALPHKLALDMLLGERILAADEVARHGFVSRVAAANGLDEAVAALAHTIAARSPYTVSLGKYGYRHQAAMSAADAYQFVTDQLFDHDLHGTAPD